MMTAPPLGGQPHPRTVPVGTPQTPAGPAETTAPGSDSALKTKTHAGEQTNVYEAQGHRCPCGALECPASQDRHLRMARLHRDRLRHRRRARPEGADQRAEDGRRDPPRRDDPRERRLPEEVGRDGARPEQDRDHRRPRLPGRDRRRRRARWASSRSSPTSPATPSPRTVTPRSSSSTSRATPTRPSTASQPTLAATKSVAARHPGLTVEQFGNASLTKQLDDAAKAEEGASQMKSLGFTLIILAADLRRARRRRPSRSSSR